MREKKEELRTNYQIRVPSVRLVGENVEPGVYDTKFAINLAEQQGLDLVEISGGDIPVARIVEYQKYMYEKRKKDKENKKKQKASQIQVKEIRMTPNTDDHDFNFKLAHAKNFIADKNKILLSVFFKGREIKFKEKGELILLRFADELKDIAIPEYLPKIEGKRMTMIIKPETK